MLTAQCRVSVPSDPSPHLLRRKEKDDIDAYLFAVEKQRKGRGKPRRKSASRTAKAAAVDAAASALHFSGSEDDSEEDILSEQEYTADGRVF